MRFIILLVFFVVIGAVFGFPNVAANPVKKPQHKSSNQLQQNNEFRRDYRHRKRYPHRRYG